MSTKKFIVAGAAGLALAASGALPAFGAVTSRLGTVFSGIVEGTSGPALLIERRQGKSPVLVAVDTNEETAISRKGEVQDLSVLASGTPVIISGTQNRDGSVLASKIIIRG